MELYRANQIINSVRASMRMDGYTIPPSLQTLGVLSLLGVDTFEKSIQKALKSPYRMTACIFIRLLEQKSLPAPAVFDFDALSSLHCRIYSDFKKNCGVLRKVNISKNGSACIDYKMLPASLKTFWEQIKKPKTETPRSKEDFAALLSFLYRELIILSPFTYGNGMALRLFLEHYAYRSGFNLDYYKAGCREFTSAENAAFASDDVQSLFKCFLKSLSYVRAYPDSPLLDQAKRTRTQTIQKTVIRPHRTQTRRENTVNILKRP